MIPQNFLEQWSAPWQTLNMVEQDLVISRALIELYNNDFIRQSLAFRGGTALNKLYLNPAQRYSEDIDLVQIRCEPIGETIKIIRSVLDDWLGSPKGKLTQRSAKLLYTFASIGGMDSRLKIEINTTEHFHINPLKSITHDVENPWFKGKADLLTYELEELMATKLCALYQRLKGRDLFDLWVMEKQLDIDKTIAIFKEFCKRTDAKITRKLFENNLQEKFIRNEFRKDIIPLLSPSMDWNFEEACYMVITKFLKKL